MSVKTASVLLSDLDKTLFFGDKGFALNGILEMSEAVGMIAPTVIDDVNNVMTRMKNDEVAYEPAIDELLRIHALGMAGVEYTAAAELAEEYFADSKGFYPFARPLLRMLGADYDSYVVTGEPEFVGAAASRELGMTGTIASRYAVEDGRFTGAVDLSLAFRESKAASIVDVFDDYFTGTSIGMGDSEGDADMLALTTVAVAVNPSPALRKLAETSDWNIASEHQVIGSVAAAIYR